MLSKNPNERKTDSSSYRWQKIKQIILLLHVLCHIVQFKLVCDVIILLEALGVLVVIV